MLGYFKQSETKSLEMYIRSAELGHPDILGFIGTYCGDGNVVTQNNSKERAFYEVSAKKGSVKSHKRLAKFHGGNGDIQKSLEHLKVAASAGDQESMDIVMRAYRNKGISKEELAQTLRACQASQNEMKSDDRDDSLAAIKASGMEDYLRGRVEGRELARYINSL